MNITGAYTVNKKYTKVKHTQRKLRRGNLFLKGIALMAAL